MFDLLYMILSRTVYFYSKDEQCCTVYVFEHCRLSTDGHEDENKKILVL